MNEAYLAELEAELRTWVDWRKGIVDTCQARIKEDQKSIREANRAFDEKALPIQRQIDELLEEEKPKPRPQHRKSKGVTVETLVAQGWDADDAAHYLDLLG